MERAPKARPWSTWIGFPAKRVVPPQQRRDLGFSIASASLALAFGFVFFLSTGQDDSYITFWSSYALAEFGEILNVNGVRLEQSSSLLYVVFLAAGKWLTGLPIPVLGYWTGIAFGALTLIRIGALCRCLGRELPNWLPGLVGTLPVFSYWCFSGFETTMVSWLTLEVAILLVRVARAETKAFAPLSLAITTGYLLVRPEAAVILGSTLLVWITVGPRGGAPAPRNAGIWLGLTAALFTLVLVFRLAYFGAPFPQPVLAKMGTGLGSELYAGLAYYERSAILRPYSLVFFLALASLGLPLLESLRHRRPATVPLPLLLFVGANAAFVLLSGGDWMRGARFFAHFAPLVVALASCAFAPRLASRRVTGLLVAFGFCLNLVGTLALSLGESTGRPLWRFLRENHEILRHSGTQEFDWTERANRIRTRDILFLDDASQAVSALLVAKAARDKSEAAERRKVTIASRQAGMMIYYLGKRFFSQLEFIDLHGLSTRHILPIKHELGAGSATHGMKMSATRYIEFLRTRGSGGDEPDLIFGILRSTAGLRDLGYHTIHEQDGAAAGPLLELKPYLRFRFSYSLYQFLAVHERWASVFSGQDARASRSPTHRTAH